MREWRAREKRLPDDFKLNEQTFRWAVLELGSDEDVQSSMFRFENHYRSVVGSKGLSNDWMAKARLWISDDAKRAKSTSSPLIAAADRQLARLRSFDAGPNDLTDEQWDAILVRFKKSGLWTMNTDQCGNCPPSPDCKAPRHLLIKHGLVQEDAA